MSKKIHDFLSIMMTAILLCSVLAGCNKREIDYNIEDEGNENVTSDGAFADDLRSILGIDTDVWDAEITSDDGLYNNVIHAEINVPDTSGMSVLEMEKKTFTNTEKKKILEEMFDADSIYAESDEDLPVWYMDYILPLMEEQMTMFTWQREAEDFEWTDQNEEDYQRLLEKQASVQAINENGAGVGVRSSDYSEDMYFGDINGQHYICAFNENGFHCYITDGSAMVSQTLMEGGQLYYYAEDDKDNQCSISKDVLEKEAEDILKALGLDEYMLYSTKAIEWSNYIDGGDENIWQDGYVFSYTRAVNGVAVDGTNYDAIARDYYDATHINQIPDFEWGQEIVNVYMNGNGLIGIDASYLYNFKRTLAEQANLMSFVKIKGLMQQLLKENSNRYGYTDNAENFIYTKMELIYVCVSGGDAEYVMLPVWRLSGYKNQQISRILCVNAMDGSEVDILDNIYHILD